MREEDAMKLKLAEAGGGSNRGQLRCICVITVLLVQVGIATSAFAIGADKVSHYAGGAGAGLAIGTVVYHFVEGMGPGQRMATSAGLGLLPGLGIEIGDEFAPHNHFSGGDLLADALGSITGAVAAELINGQFWISASGRQIRLIGRW
jgi:putative lipoprotein